MDNGQKILEDRVPDLPTTHLVNEAAVPNLTFDLMRLPVAPERPLDSDCCGGGCVPCVMDIYQQELELWQRECDAIRTGVHSPDPLEKNEQEDPKAFRLCSNKYTKFHITGISQEATDIVRIRCRLPGKLSLGLSIGQHIIIRFFDVNGSSLTRQYTPTSPTFLKGSFELMIKIYPEGRASQFIKEWKVGDCVEARGPAGHLSYKRNKYEKVLMLCAGTGVAPMCQVAHSILNDEEDDTVLKLVYAARDYGCLMARQEIREWSRFWNFSCLFLLSQEPENPTWQYKHGEQVQRGRVDSEVIRRELGSRPLSVLVLVCGTRAFDSNVISCLEELGVPQSNVHRF